MKAILVGAAAPLVGKTTVAVGLAQLLSQAGRSSRLVRMEGDEGAAADARLFSSLGGLEEPLTAAEAARRRAADDLLIAEAPAGPCLDALSTLDAGLILVARPQGLREGPQAWAGGYAEDVLAMAREAKGHLLGVVVTAVAAATLKELEAALTPKPLALLPEDRLLAAPTLHEATAALEAQSIVGNGSLAMALPRLMVASIASDPAFPYFNRYEGKAVIARCDKPDLLLAAITAGAQCLIVTGGRPPLSYVIARAEEEGIPLLLVRQDTVSTAKILEALYKRARLAGPQKIARAQDILQECADLAALRKALGP
ncbi:MAG TPA: DRTGG domain-containing protein [Dehalococcoidia bacterium]|nr:DRTGG domain-containing protein [Dehalococcoidia bacterium]